MDQRRIELLTWLDEIANWYSLNLDKYHKGLAEEANKIISQASVDPVGNQPPKFPIQEELKTMRGAVVGVDSPQKGI